MGQRSVRLDLKRFIEVRQRGTQQTPGSLSVPLGYHHGVIDVQARQVDMGRHRPRVQSRCFEVLALRIAELLQSVRKNRETVAGVKESGLNANGCFEMSLRCQPVASAGLCDSLLIFVYGCL